MKNLLSLPSLAGLMLVLAPCSAFATLGLDQTFNVSAQPMYGGTTAAAFFDLTPAQGDDFAYSVAIQPNGKIIAGGTSNFAGTQYFSLARFNANGTLDTTFSSDGKAYEVPNAFGRSVLVQGDGKILMAGDLASGSGPGGSVLARFNSDGSLDTMFGPAGTGSFPGIMTTSFASSVRVTSMKMQLDGKILVTASASDSLKVMRFDAGGTLDASFGQGGIVSYAGMSGGGMSVASNGTIAIAGSTIAANVNSALLVLDSSGAVTGFAEQELGSLNAIDLATDVMIMPDGKIVLAGQAYDGTGYRALTLSRYLQNGSLDLSFGSSGVSQSHFRAGDDVTNGALELSNDGYLTVVGSSLLQNGFQQVGVARFTANGVLDTTPGFAPYTFTFIGAAQNTPGDVLRDAEGRFVIVGSRSGSLSDYGVARVLPEPGSLLLAGLGVAAISLRRNRRRA